MNHPKIIIRVIILTLVALIAAGCAPAKAVPEMNIWRLVFSKEYANVRITFEPGDKCVLEQLNSVSDNEFGYEVVVNDDEHENYMVTIATLTGDKTFKDLQEETQKHPEDVIPPYFVHLEGLQVVYPMSRNWAAMHLPTGYVYITCIVQGPGHQRIIANVGPVEIK